MSEITDPITDAGREMAKAERELLRGAEIPAPAPADPRGPEKLTVPPEMVGDLIMCAIRSQEGNAVWRGFVAAHGHPAWVVRGEWRLAVAPAEVVQNVPNAERAERNGRL